jgi:hypothetical protein
LLPIETWLPIDPIELIDPVIAVDPLLPVESIPDIVSGFDPIQVTTIITPVEVPITDPVSFPITPVVEVAEIDAAVDVVGLAIVVEVSQQTEQVALPFLPQLNLRSTTRPRVEQLARFDAFESFDNLLVLSASMADLADHSVNSMRSLAAEGLEGDTAELGDWGAIVDALAAESLLAELAV